MVVLGVMVTLTTIYSRYKRDIQRLQDLLSRLTGSGADAGGASAQKAIAELVLLRLFYKLEGFLEDAITRLCCGATYIDGTIPDLNITSKSRLQAKSNMRTYGRPKSIELKWTTESSIKGNIGKVIKATDPIYTTLRNHSDTLDRMRRIRNHIAHGNADTSRKFRPVVLHHYGAALVNITPGILLLSDRFNPSIISSFFIFARVFARDLAKG